MRTLLTVLSVLVLSVAHSQELESVFAQSGSMPEDNGEIIWDDVIVANIKFTFKDEIVIVEDESNSTYAIGDSYDIDDITHWDALDERSEPCVVSLHNQYGYMIFTVYYKTIVFRYFFELNN